MFYIMVRNDLDMAMNLTVKNTSKNGCVGFHKTCNDSILFFL